MSLGKLIFTFIFASLSSWLISQENVTFNGRVFDATTGEIQIGIRIEIVETGALAVTNEYGYYSVTAVAQDSLTIKASGIGYIDE